MPALMVVGTTSNAGKSMLVTVLCRHLARLGYRVAPFKGQNMALNAYVTAEGGEMGYAQAVQAWAAGREPVVAMNPILLKPQGDMTSQVIFQGQVVGTTSAANYYRDYFEPGWQVVQQALMTLEPESNWIVCEGAGSPAEPNLKHRDLTNMRVARYLNAPTLLVVDIDPGGAFAHVIGTLALLDPEERALIRGIVINKFRGQRSILEPALTWLEAETGIPVVGVIPYLAVDLPAEDSLNLLTRPRRNPDAELQITVIRLPRVANFTDFDPLVAEPTVQVTYVSPGETLRPADAVILPGTKTTVADLAVLRASGLADQLTAYVHNGGHLIGVCGGFQMLGQMVADPAGREGEALALPGLGLLPVTTALAADKITRQRQVTSVYPQAGRPVAGYEIHQGRTQLLEPLQPLFDDPDLGVTDAAGRVWGMYLHGVWDNGPWRRDWLNGLRQRRGLPPLPGDVPDFHSQRLAALDRLADAVLPHLNLKHIHPGLKGNHLD
ncbi:MAG: cobyric acid synthase [Gloeomargaritaceae cyanobacterium C42_A2020_066]|nr:cobyric acid synthase [Gloeomargaritaceae cyanobacterium C42_A2020_066]